MHGACNNTLAIIFLGHEVLVNIKCRFVKIPEEGSPNDTFFGGTTVNSTRDLGHRKQ